MSLQIDIYLPHTIIPIEIKDKETIKKFCYHYSYRENPNSSLKHRYLFYLLSQRLTKYITNQFYLEIDKTNWIELLFRDKIYYLTLSSYNIKVNYCYTSINLTYHNLKKKKKFCLPTPWNDYRTIGPIIQKITIEKKI